MSTSCLFDFNKTGNEILKKQQDELTIEQAKSRIDSMGMKPLISVIMPLYNPPVQFLEKAIESLQEQFYENWELCAVDDGSLDKRGCALIEKIAQSDKRISLYKMQENKGISYASNRALEMANGEFVALVDQDDEITPDAFFWFVDEINEYHNADFIYSDECSVNSEVHELKDFYFKPDWSPALLINHMYTGHLTMYRTELVRKIGGFRSEYDFSQDYDLALRMAEVAQNIRHVERVLYFWRIHPISAAGGGKPFARISNLLALKDYYKRQGMHPIIEKQPYSNYGSLIMETNPKISIIIPSDSLERLEVSIDGLLTKTSYKNIEIIPVTNSMTANSVLREHPYVDCIKMCFYDKIFNFSDKCNEGAKMASGDILVFYNDDVIPRSMDWIERQIEMLYHSNVGGVSPMMVYENNTIQYAGMATGLPGIIGTVFNGVNFESAGSNPFNHLLIRDVSVLSGACLFIKKRIFDEIGGFDAINTPNGHSDLDLSLKLLERGYRCVYTPHAVMTHIGNHSWGARNSADKADIYCIKKWGQYIGKDPYFTASMKKMFYRDFTYQYEIYSPDNLIVPNKSTSKDILFVTHELSLTGAPLILKDMVQIVLDEGNFPVVLSPLDGILKQEFLDMGVTVILDESFVHNHWMFERFARNFDLVVANTMGCANVVCLLKNSLPPVLWWVHEGEYALEHFRSILPDELGEKTKMYASSNYTINVLKNANMKYECSKLFYGMPDTEANPLNNGIKDYKFLFVIVGSVEKRKGQDIVVQAIERLNEGYKAKAEFVFIGNPIDEEIHDLVLGAIKRDNCISYLPPMPKTELANLYRKAICVIIASRDDPLPLVAIESMIHSKILICSDKTGFGEYVTDGQDVMIFSNENAVELAEKIKYVIDNREVSLNIGNEARKVYERHFTMECYRASVNKIVREMTKNGYGA